MPNCRKALSQINPLPPALTLYGQYKSGSTRVYIAGTDDDLGIYVLSEGRCEAGVPILALLQRHGIPRQPGEAPELTDTEVQGIFRDAVNRYIKAFGGKSNFFDWLDKSTEEARGGCKGPDSVCPPTYHSFSPAMQDILETHRKD